MFVEGAAAEIADASDPAVAGAPGTGAPRVATGVVGSVDERRLAQLGERGRAVAARIAALQSELVSIAGEVRRLEGRLVGSTPRAWAAWQWGLTPAESGRVFRLAERLPDLPGLAAELEAGRLSEGVVEALSSVATPANEAEVVATAHQATGAQLQSLVRTMRRVQRADRPAPAAEERCTAGPRDDGLWHLAAGLSPERGAVVDRALAAERERLVDGVRADRAAGVPEADAPWPTAADALVALARSGLAGVARADGSLPERFRTTVVVDADSLAEVFGAGDGRNPAARGGPDAAGPPPMASERRCELVGIGAIEPWLAAELACRSALSVLVTEHGRPVTLTEPSPAPTARQQRALEVRDRTCRFPGCGATRDVHAHHAHDRVLGGPTRLDNLVLLCPRHHRAVHRWHLTVAIEGTDVHVTRPDGSRVDAVPARPEPPPPPDPPPPRPAHPHDRLTAFGADVVLHAWQRAREPAPACAAER